MQVFIRYFSKEKIIKTIYLGVLFFVVPVFCYNVTGQVLHIGLSVPAEFVATDFQRPEVVLLPSRQSGTATTMMTDSTGRLAIETMENTILVISVERPDDLISAAGERICLFLDFFWLNTGGRDKRNALHLKTLPHSVRMHKSDFLFDRIPVQQNFLRAFLFIAMGIYAGEASTGIYQGSVSIVLEYN